jgi:hypothetical protein
MLWPKGLTRAARRMASASGSARQIVVKEKAIRSASGLRNRAEQKIIRAR